MKIAFIYSYVLNEIWSTPLSLATEFQSRGWEVDIFSLLDSNGGYTDAGIRHMVDRIYGGGYEPDIIFYLDWGRFDSHILDHDIYPKAFWIQEAGDEPQNYERNFPKSDRFDLTLSPDYQSTERYKAAGRNAIFLTHFADTCVYFPMKITPKYQAVSTRGQGSSVILDRLQYHLGGSFKNDNGYLGIAHGEALQQGHIVVQHSRHGEITRRIFEAMACGKMVLTDRLDKSTHIEDLFQHGVDIVYYDNFEDLRNKLDYYIDHPEEREKIAFNGRMKVIGKHTQYQRVDAILKQFRLWKS